jgi:hypothetical protein
VARLVTIPISHFCEKARWALDRAGVDDVQQPICSWCTCSRPDARAGGGPSRCSTGYLVFGNEMSPTPESG